MSAMPPAEFQKPAGAGTPATGDEPVIHVIPEKFYGAALKLKAKTPPMPPAVPPKPPVAPPPAPVPAPPQPAKPGSLPPPKPKGKKWIIVAVLAVLLLGAIAAVFFVFNRSIEQPGNANTAPPSKTPYCGDNTCDADESTATCAADCPAPAPVCGDTKCESGETTASCAADCPAPAPVCGDNKCEASETAESCADDCGPPPPPPPPKGGTDSDSDGLTDLEETGIYGTSTMDSNTDKDSFVDVNEVLNLFDPSKPTPAKLSENPGVRVRDDAALAVSVHHPAAWTITAPSDDKSVFFYAPGGEFIQVLVQENPDRKTLMDWYLEQAPGVSSSQVNMFKTRQGYDEILSPDGFTAFIASGNRIAVIAYNLASSAEIQYKSTFAMMVNSLIIK